MRQLRLVDEPDPELGVLPRAKIIVEQGQPLGLLDYAIPKALSHAIKPGVAVLVPLRRQQVQGYVASIDEHPPPTSLTLRSIAAIDTHKPAIPLDVLELVLFASSYYVAAPGDVLAAAIPPAERPSSKRYDLTQEGKRALGESMGDLDRAVLDTAVAIDKTFTSVAIERALGWNRQKAQTRLRRLCDKQWLCLREQSRTARKVAAFKRTHLAPDAALSKRPALMALLEAIPTTGVISATALAQQFSNPYPKLKILTEAKLIERTEIVKTVQPQHTFDAYAGNTSVPTLTESQAQVMVQLRACMSKKEYATFLLQGVTGSGKTEIYLRLISDALSIGKTALVLVPEIALTPQLGARFRARFGDKVATFHSGLTAAQRRDEWERVAKGEATIGLGARSALFLPLSDIGVIVVDEEHETSFKQDESPRYNARDLAVFRGRQHGAIVVLGSATPALETRHNAQTQRYGYVVLPQRVGSKPLPQSEVIDLTTAERVSEGIFTEPMAQAIEETLRRDEQGILFLNRRGFSPYVVCRDCGHTFRCDDCAVGLVLHRGRDLLMCHYCDFTIRTPDQCPKCEGLHLQGHGLGTERLESEIKNIFGDVPLSRLDRDTVRKRSDMQLQLERFARGDTRLLIGTQMVAKGHDFPGVTFVGVVAADATLSFPDFRAAERTFQLLTQVAGRSGRGDKPGRVLIQAYDTEHYAIAHALQHDYEGFVAQELALRQELGYPPYTRLCLVRYEGANEQETRATADLAANAMRAAASNTDETTIVLGPATAPLARLRGLYRFHILIKATERRALLHVLGACPKTPSGTRHIVDIDPINML